MKELIEKLKGLDGEKLEHLIRAIGMDDQILKQLFVQASDLTVSNLIEERDTALKSSRKIIHEVNVFCNASGLYGIKIKRGDNSHIPKDRFEELEGAENFAKSVASKNRGMKYLGFTEDIYAWYQKNIK